MEPLACSDTLPNRAISSPWWNLASDVHRFTADKIYVPLCEWLLSVGYFPPDFRTQHGALYTLSTPLRVAVNHVGTHEHHNNQAMGFGHAKLG